MRNFECGRPLLEWSLPVAHLLGLTQNFEYDRPLLGECCRGNSPSLDYLQLVGFVRVVSAVARAFRVDAACQPKRPPWKLHSVDRI